MTGRWLISWVLFILSPTVVASPFDGALDELTRQQDFTSMRANSSARDQESNDDAKAIPPGETLVLLDAVGPGIITHFWKTWPLTMKTTMDSKRNRPSRLNKRLVQ